MKTTYLNTDLDLSSLTPIDDLVNAFQADGRFSVLHYSQSEDGKWYSIIESEYEGEFTCFEEDENSVQSNRIPEKNIRIMLDLILSLSGDLKKQWDQCEKRELNLGYNFGETKCFQQFLSGELVKQIADAGCSIGVTLYNIPELGNSSCKPDPE